RGSARKSAGHSARRRVSASSGGPTDSMPLLCLAPAVLEAAEPAREGHQFFPGADGVNVPALLAVGAQQVGILMPVAVKVQQQRAAAARPLERQAGNVPATEVVLVLV